MNIGILGGANIAFDRFIPACMQLEGVECAAVASNSKERRNKFRDKFNVPTCETYDEILMNPQIEAVYIPLPPALHYKWAKKALEKGKHVLLEKPSATSYKETEELVGLAQSRGLAITENYMFQYHSQLKAICDMVEQGVIGTPYLYQGRFGFPKREGDDFRYRKELGGGALLDAGGYVVKLGTILLGETSKLISAKSLFTDEFEVDIFGGILMTNDKSVIYQGAYGMDCEYQCSLEIWGSKGRLYTNRIFTAPSGYQPKVSIFSAGKEQEISLNADEHFQNSIRIFKSAIEEPALRAKLQKEMMKQAEIMDKVRQLGGC